MPLTDDELAAQIQRGQDPNADLNEAFAEHDADQIAADARAAKALGVTFDQLRAARRFGMEPEEYAAYDTSETINGRRVAGPSNLDTVVAAEQAAQAAREAREQAQHERLVELAKKRLRGE
ncbi:MAG: hypothetical protein QOI10_2186 [Solirubrobacterales bacterium]|jgi:hypothetical protein|nr:hypothetical protein [Solirubrobacterales bacterium]